MSNISIVDVSRYQKVTNLACQTVHLFLTKASQAQRKASPDPQLENTYRVVRRNSNTAFAPYHYFWRTKAADNGRRQAETMAAVLEKLVTKEGGPFSDLRWNERPLVWLDVDPVYAAGGEPAIPPALLEKQIWGFIDGIEALLGAAVGIYTSQSAWSGVTGGGKPATTEIPVDRPLWVSNPRTTGEPLIPWDWESRYGPRGWQIWQHSFTGKIPGIVKPDQPSVPAVVDLNRANGDLAWFNAQFATALTPKPVVVTPPPPVLGQPERIEIVIQGGERLNLRTGPFQAIVAETWNGVQFPVIGRADDGQGRPWWQLAPELYVASWYCKKVG